MYKHKYNISILLEECNLNLTEVVNLIQLGLLIPDAFNPNEFRGITRYKLQTFRNNVHIIDSKALVMRLDIEFYKDLVWHKIKNKWQTPLQDFLQLRKGFKYDLWIDEKKRKGEFTSRMKIQH